MSKYLVIIIYLIFISLGLPDSLLGSGWPIMQKEFNVKSSYAGYVSMTISAMTILSSLFSVYVTNKLTEKWVVIISIAVSAIALILFSISKHYWNLFLFAIPYGLSAGSIDSAMNNFVAAHYSSRVMNFLHCCYGVGSSISPFIMALALKYKSWKEGYRWTSYIQMGILVICLCTIRLWKIEKEEEKENKDNKNEKGENEEKIEDKSDDRKSIEESKNQMLKLKNNKLRSELNNMDKNIDTKAKIETKIESEIQEDKKKDNKLEIKEDKKEEKKIVGILEAIKIRGVKFSCLAFFAYCSGEGTCFLWTSSFFDKTKEGLSKEAVASLSSTVFGGLMLGRVISGIVSERLGDKKLIRIGICIEIIGIICVGIPIKHYFLAIIGFSLALIGMGPIYPSIQHLAPIYFGKEAGATVIGLQMASAYVGFTLMPFLFGIIQEKTSMWALPIFVGTFTILNFIFSEIEFRLCENKNEQKSENIESKK